MSTDAAAPEAVRPPEDALATRYAYYETLVYHWKKDQVVKWDCIDRLKEPKNLVLVANIFTSTKQVGGGEDVCVNAFVQSFFAGPGCVSAPQYVPELFAKLETRLNDDAELAKLSGPYLSTLAFAFAGNHAGSPEFFKKIAAAAAKAGVESSYKANLAWALEQAGVDASGFK